MEMRCEALSGDRFDTPRCKRMTIKTASGVPYCGEDHDFETSAEMWERLYRETLYNSNLYEKLLNARTQEVLALRKQIEIISGLDAR